MLFDLSLMVLSLSLIVTGIILLGKVIGDDNLKFIETIVLGILIGKYLL